jgi:hypothetical protein
VTNGRRWLALDADMFGKPFTLDLHHEFGWAGIGVWVAFLCACKRSRIPGRFTFLCEADARAQLGILGWELTDDQGKPWTLDDFWLYTGRKKQTRRTRRGREMNVTPTHWERWQQDAGRSREAERMRRTRGQNRSDRVPNDPNTARTNVRLDKDIDSDTPQPPAERGAEVALRADPQNLRAGLDAVIGSMPPPPPPPKGSSR